MLAFVLAMTVTMALIPPLMQVAGRWHVLDAPGERKVHSQPIPRVGGIAMATGLLLGLTLFGDFAQPMPAYLAGVLVLLVFGVLDDRFTLSAGPKFIGQIAAAVLVMTWGDIRIETVTLVDRHVLPVWIEMPLTLFFILGVTNAINLSDGLDGLAGGTTLLCLSALALLSMNSEHPFVGAVAITCVGSILGFLRFNTHPARVFMGDGGSQVLGFSAGVLGIVLTQTPSSPLSTALPLLLLGVPIVDTLMVMTQRVLEGRSPFSADRYHIHHRLLGLGLDHHEAVIAIYCLQAVLFVLAWFLRFESDLLLLTVFASFAAIVLGTLHFATKRDWAPRRRGQRETRSAVSRSVRWITQPQQLPRWALVSIAAVVTAYAVAVGVKMPAPPLDVRLLSVALAAILAFGLLMRRAVEQLHWLQKAALYTTAVVVVYCDWKIGGALDTWLAGGDSIAFGLLAAAIVVRFRLSSDRRFRVTPLDVLVVFAAIAIPNLPGALATPAVGLAVGKLIVLLYAIESLLGAPDRAWRAASSACLTFALLCALQGV